MEASWRNAAGGKNLRVNEQESLINVGWGRMPLACGLDPNLHRLQKSAHPSN